MRKARVHGGENTHAIVTASALDDNRSVRGLIASFLRFNGFVVADTESEALEGIFTGENLHTLEFQTKGLKLYIRFQAREDTPAESFEVARILYPRDMGMYYTFVVPRRSK